MLVICIFESFIRKTHGARSLVARNSAIKCAKGREKKGEQEV